MSSVYAAPKLRTVNFFNRRYLNLYSIGNAYGLRVSRKNGRINITGKYHRFSFTPNKMTSSFNGVQIVLSHAIYENKGSFYISEIDYNTVMKVLLNRKNMKRHLVRTIFLDPGHGGRDVGAEGKYYYEKNLTMRLAVKVRKYLRNAGFKVIMSRWSDVFISLDKRAAIANRNKADVFVSIHFNSAANKKVYGLETYCMSPAGASSSNASKIDYKKYPGNLHDQNNFALAYLMQRAMLGNTKALDRGVKHARFLVLKEVKMPAVLVECGFLSHPGSERIIGNDRYLEQVARGIAQSIINYRKVAEKAAY